MGESRLHKTGFLREILPWRPQKGLNDMRGIEAIQRTGEIRRSVIHLKPTGLLEATHHWRFMGEESMRATNFIRNGCFSISGCILEMIFSLEYYFSFAFTVTGLNPSSQNDNGRS